MRTLERKAYEVRHVGVEPTRTGYKPGALTAELVPSDLIRLSG